MPYLVSTTWMSPSLQTAPDCPRFTFCANMRNFLGMSSPHCCSTSSLFGRVLEQEPYVLAGILDTLLQTSVVPPRRQETGHVLRVSNKVRKLASEVSTSGSTVLIVLSLPMSWTAVLCMRRLSTGRPDVSSSGRLCKKLSSQVAKKAYPSVNVLAVNAIGAIVVAVGALARAMCLQRVLCAAQSLAWQSLP
jgi:hypothetical protein